MDSKKAPNIEIRPLGAMVVIRPIATPQKPSPIILVSPEAGPASRGEVVAVGPEVKTVIRGDRVVFSKLQGYELAIGEPVILIREQAILATV